MGLLTDAVKKLKYRSYGVKPQTNRQINLCRSGQFVHADMGRNVYLFVILYIRNECYTSIMSQLINEVDFMDCKM